MSEHIIPQEVATGTIDTLNKGLGWLDEPLETQQIVARGWNLLREDLSLPCAVLYDEKLKHNLAWMKQFIDAYGVKLAPHGKTTMAPGLFRRQLDSGAWGITLATAHQTLSAWKHGVRRVLMANQLVGRQNMEIVARLLEDPGFEYFCLVDSAALVEQLGAFFGERGRRVNVLLELGVANGRAGVRHEEQLRSVLAAIERWKPVVLCGVEIYEGVLGAEDEIRAFLRRAVETMRRLLAEDRIERKPALLSGAGSAWYDVVAEEFATAKFGDAVDIVLRPGCYLTHDVGSYKNAQERILAHNPVAKRLQEGFVPAMHVWAYVQSIPEPERAIITLGKRDAAFDSGLPVPALQYRPGEAAPNSVPRHWELTKMMDQHAYMQIRPGDDVRVGDMIGFDISHPCLTFDKWRVIPIVDEKFNVVDLVRTYF